MNSSRVYNLNKDGKDRTMNISLTSYSVNEWVYTLLYITSHRMAEMVICRGMDMMDASTGLLRIYCEHSILWRQKIEISTIFPGGVFLGTYLL